MATINLGAIKFNWKGAFNNSTAYAVDDVVSSGGNSYVCIQASQGNAVGNATAYWNIMSTKGTNGTNGTDLSSLLSTRGDLVFKNASALARLAKGTAGQVLGQGANDPAWVNGSSSTLTTQGDVLYRDGSGLQRLAKGTANKVLAMNSAANAPEWQTAASGEMVKISTGSFSNVGTLTIDGTAKWGANNTYSMHKLVFYNFDPVQSSNLQLRQTNNGSVVTGSIYSGVVTQRNCSNSNQALISQNEDSFWRLTYDNLRGDMKHNFHLDIYNMMVTDNKANISVTSHIGAPNQDGDTRLISHLFAGCTQTNSANNPNRTGLLIYQTAGNISGNYAVYGIKR